MARKFGQFQRIEVGFGLDNFSKPIAYSNREAWARQIIQLCTFEPGTIPSNPTIGVGMRRYDFLLENDRRKLETEINRQVPIFFPDMPFVSCQVVESDEMEQDILYLVITLSSGENGQPETVVVATKKGYNYIDFAIAL